MSHEDFLYAQAVQTPARGFFRPETAARWCAHEFPCFAYRRKVGYHCAGKKGLAHGYGPVPRMGRCLCVSLRVRDHTWANEKRKRRFCAPIRTEAAYI